MSAGRTSSLGIPILLTRTATGAQHRRGSNEDKSLNGKRKGLGNEKLTRRYLMEAERDTRPLGQREGTSLLSAAARASCSHCFLRSPCPTQVTQQAETIACP